MAFGHSQCQNRGHCSRGKLCSFPAGYAGDNSFPQGTRVHLLLLRVMFVVQKHSSSLWEPAKMFVSAMTVHTASQRSTCKGNVYGEAHHYCPGFENMFYTTRVPDSGGQLPNADAKWVKDAAHRLPMGWLG